MTGTLYVVATPIGNLGDISGRGRDVLAEVAIIACEDTRRTSALLSQLGIKKPTLLAYHDHNEAAVAARVLRQLAAGDDVALVSDAGTPLVSDPGYELVTRCWTEGISLVPVPGASAVSAALSVCPISCAQYTFVGFLPAKANKRVERLQELMVQSSPSVFFEAPHRIEECLRNIAQVDGERLVFVAREVTKKFEQFLCAPALSVLDDLLSADAVRGEFVCVVAGAEAPSGTTRVDEQQAAQLLEPLLAELSPAAAARVASKITGINKSQLYDAALKIKGAKIPGEKK